MKENLLGVLAGDFSFSFRAGTGMHIRIRKLKETTDGFETVIEEAYFSNADGRRLDNVGGVLQFSLCVDQEPTVVETDTELLQSFVISTDQQAEFAHRAMVSTIGAFTEKEKTFSWRQILTQNRLPHLSAAHSKWPRMRWMRDSSSEL